jgi:hypothetical protein
MGVRVSPAIYGDGATAVSPSELVTEWQLNGNNPDDDGNGGSVSGAITDGYEVGAPGFDR